MVGKELRKKFEFDVASLDSTPRVLVTVTRVPSGALETQVNTEKLAEKIDYIMNTYGNDFSMVGKPEIQIVGFILA